ncbi:MAG TPA: hypothetical protein PK986_06260 [Spirochaetota bacterium]|nr:hypothetical protein [Spirochaetota bacterium]HQO40053.1 hypothetical protein [Spirochaetota bacterium]
MVFERSNTVYFFAFMIIGAILGSALGSLIVKFAPGLKLITESLTGPVGFNLEIISLSLKLNLASLTGLVLGIVIFRKV